MTNFEDLEKKLNSSDVKKKLDSLPDKSIYDDFHGFVRPVSARAMYELVKVAQKGLNVVEEWKLTLNKVLAPSILQMTIPTDILEKVIYVPQFILTRDRKRKEEALKDVKSKNWLSAGIVLFDEDLGNEYHDKLHSRIYNRSNTLSDVLSNFGFQEDLKRYTKMFIQMCKKNRSPGGKKYEQYAQDQKILAEKISKWTHPIELMDLYLAEME